MTLKYLLILFMEGTKTRMKREDKLQSICVDLTILTDSLFNDDLLWSENVVSFLLNGNYNAVNFLFENTFENSKLTNEEVVDKAIELANG